MRRTKHWIAVFCMVMVWLCAVPSQAAAVSDIEGHWAETEIEWAVQQGIFSDGSGEPFDPDATLTRAAFVSSLAGYDGAELPSAGKGLTDVPADSPYARAVQWAVANDIAFGTSAGQFLPDQALTREQLAIMLIRYANYKGTVLPRVRSRNVQFSDMDACSDCGLDAMYTLYRAGVLDMTDQKICPQDVVTYADCAVILYRYHDACAETCTEKQQAMVISHMGYSVAAPENTLPAYVLSDEKQYTYVETDVRFTKDNVPVLLHDATIDRTSNGSGKVAKMTYAQLKVFQFNATQPDYGDVSLPTFRQFIRLCSQRYLHPYIELKSTMSGKQLEQLFDIVAQYGMTSHVSWISFDYSNLKRIRTMYPTAELGYLISYADSSSVDKAEKLKNGKNRVYLCAQYANLTDAVRAQCLREGVYLEVWTINDRKTAVRQLNTSAQGVTVDGLTAADIYC